MKKLVQELQLEGVLVTPRISNAFRAIDRADFVPPELQDRAYDNTALPLGYGATISQPLTVAYVLELLQPRPGDRVLDIGSGSGWQTALLAHIVSRDDQGRLLPTPGSVYGVEIVPELVDMSRRNLAKYSFLDKGIVQLFNKNAANGLPACAPYDRIVAAATVSEIPTAWLPQLTIDGRLLAPRGNSLVVRQKITEEKFEEQEFPGFVFVPFVGQR